MMLVSLTEVTIFLCKDSWKRNTLNSKVNNWAVEMEQYHIKFKYIKGIKKL